MAREGLNRVTLIGNLGADPELKFTQGGQALMRMRLATTESYTDRSGERKDRTEWHTVLLWGKRAEALNKFLAKGHTLCVEGKIQYRQWDDKEGNKRNSTEINANNIVLLGGGGRRNEGGGGGGGGGGFAPSGGGGDFGGGGDSFPAADQFGDDDVPF